jgi:quercetin dioxygenase-like cupin family protein
MTKLSARDEVEASQSDARPVLRQADAARSVTLGPNRVEFVLDAAETGGRYSLTAWTMAPPPAPGPPGHVHQDADEAIYVLEGALECQVGGQSITAAPGAVILVPRGTWHTLTNVGSDLARFLVILSPPGFEQYWAEVSTLLATTGGTPDPGELLALQRKYRMESQGRPRRFG